MSDAVISALIVAASSIIVQLIISWNSSKKQAVEAAKKEERLNARLQSIEHTLEENNHKLDIHNGYADKIGDIQIDIAYIKGKMEGETS